MEVRFVFTAGPRHNYLATSQCLPARPSPFPLRNTAASNDVHIYFVARVQINKFCLFGGERTTTIGKPSDLGEGNRDLRAIWRALSTPRDLVRALVRGQGLTDLRDMDGVVMAAPESEVCGLLVVGL